MAERITITASAGTYLTNGEIYAKKIELGDWDKAETYHEISAEEYETAMKEC